MMIEVAIATLLSHSTAGRLSLRELRLLTLAATDGGVSLRDAASTMAAPKPAVSRSANVLEQEQLVTRSGDKRTVLVATMLGRHMLSSMNVALYEARR